MIKKQRKVSTQSLGNDTHTRNYDFNDFKKGAHQTFQGVVGEIIFPEPEPIFKQNMVSVKFARGGMATSVAYPGAFTDPITGNLHGLYEGPIPGQMVMVGFENGNQHAPYVINRYPYQGAGNTLFEAQYILPLTKSLRDSTDVTVGHFSGSFLTFNTGLISGNLPGSVNLYAMTDLTMESNLNFIGSSLLSMELSSLAVTIEGTATAEVTAPLVTLTAATAIELNGNTNFAVKYTELLTAFNLLKTELNAFITIFNAHTHPYVDTPIGPSVTSVSATPGIPAVADMSAAQNLKVLM